MNHKLANVALPVPLAQLFTYSIPSYLIESASRGSIVVVPFGKKRSIGVIINFPESAPDMVIKSIVDVLDSTSISDDNLMIAEWIAEYYVSPLGETLKLFLPVGMQQSSKRMISLSSVDPKTIDQLSRISPQRKKILQILRIGACSVQQLQKKTGIKSIYAVINGLAKEGVVQIEEKIVDKPKPKREWFLRKISSGQNFQLRGKAQQQAWNLISTAETTDELSVKALLKQMNVSLSSVQGLAEKGLVSLYQKEVSRTTAYKIDDHTAKGLSIRLNQHQQTEYEKIAAAIDTHRHHTFLLHGITGSGKTQVYIEAIRHAMQQNKTSIVLVPEISLTPQTVRRFQLHFGDAVVWIHSRMSVGERYDAWRSANERRCKIVIGPRSALFAPLHNLGLIIVDEEHDSSYKQFDATPRYHARDVAIVRGTHSNAVIVLGSATPSIESFANASSGKYTLLTLPERVDNAILPPIRIVNMVDERKRRFAVMKEQAKTIGRKAFIDAAKSISKFLEDKIRDRIEKKEGIILLQNRRGFAPFIECIECGYVEQCDRCSVTMTYHAPQKHLRCHYCGKVKQPPTVCLKCGGFQFSLQGFGTQRVEEELTALFPSAKILRMDLDTTTQKHSHEKLLHQFGKGDADILLGTQMVAKGLDFPRVTLVGVISTDTQMMLPDFRSAERTFQLLTQVAGRAGRSTLAGEVIIQTSQPEHYALAHVKDHNFISFYKEELEYRRSIGYPPFSRIVVIEFKGKNEKKVESLAMTFGRKLASHIAAASMLGPTPAVLSKINNEFRWQIIVKADKEKDKNGTRTRGAIVRVVNELHSESTKENVKVIVDVDPVGIM